MHPTLLSSKSIAFNQRLTSLTGSLTKSVKQLTVIGPWKEVNHSVWKRSQLFAYCCTNRGQSSPSNTDKEGSPVFPAEASLSKWHSNNRFRKNYIYFLIALKKAKAKSGKLVFVMIVSSHYSVKWISNKNNSSFELASLKTRVKNIRVWRSWRDKDDEISATKLDLSKVKPIYHRRCSIFQQKTWYKGVGFNIKYSGLFILYHITPHRIISNMIRIFCV